MSAVTTERKSITPGTTRSERDNGRAHDRRAPAPASASPVPLAAAGNQTVAALYSEGIVRAHLQVGAPDDPIEAEADRMAASALRGEPCTCAAGAPPCPRCQTAARGMIRRKPRAAGRAPAVADNLSLGAGRGLGEPERRFFEARYQTDLSNVRIHDDAQAAVNAAQLNARAFSVGERIAFGAGEYRPQSQEGRALLAHELAHVVQGHSGIRRQGQSTEPNMTPADANASFQPPEGPTQSSLNDPAHLDHDANFDPCAVNERTLTNYALLAELNNTNAYVNRGRDQDRFFDYRNLQRRLNAELGRRVQLGHVWLQTAPNAIPGTLIRVASGHGDTMDVVRVSGAIDSGAPESTVDAPLMTEAQFQNFLERQQIATIQAEEYRRHLLEERLGGTSAVMTAGGLYNTPLDYALMDPFARPILGSRGGEIMKWRGRFGEAGFSSRASSGYGFFLDDLNARTWVDRRGVTHQPTEENFPIFDFERTATTPGARVLGTARVSVKTSLQANQADRFSYYREGFSAMFETSSRSALPSYVSNQPQFAGQTTSGPQYEANRSQVLSDAFLAINSEDVAEFRRLLSDPTQTESPRGTVSLWDDRGQRRQSGPPRRGWRQVFEGEMREHPVTVNGQTYNSPDALDTAARTGQISTEQHTAAQREVGRRVSARTLSAGIGGGEVSGLRSARLGISGLSEPQLRPLLTPEYMRAQRAGGGVAGEVRAAGGAGVQGAGAGGLIAVITTAGVMLFDEADHPDWERELATSGGLGTLGGFTGGAAEQALISRGTQSMIGDVAATGASRLSPELTVGLGRFGGGGVGAGIVELASMGWLEKREHSGTEITVRTGRAFVLGGSSAVIGAEAGAGATVLATAVAGAAGGSIAPGVGTAIGFIVGLVVGGVVYYLGDRALPGGREDWEAAEAGCRPTPVPSSSASAGGYNSILFTCFAADTPVLLADGKQRQIAELAVGDLVLSYNERERRLEARAVTAVHEAPPEPMLLLRLVDGTTVRVTSSHKLRTAQGWRAAAELRAGDVLFAAHPGAAGETHDIAGKTLDAISVSAPSGPVYDLSIEQTHTYFAASVLAHNKLP